MADISQIDKNFKVATDIEKDDIKFYNVDEAPFKVYGLFKKDGKYRRMPADIAEKVSEGVRSLHAHTAGGRVRFVTDSSYVAIHVDMDAVCKMPHFAFTGSIGLDMYVSDKYVKTFVPNYGIKDGYEGIVEFPTKEMREITINFPLYSEVKDLYIGLEESANLKEAMPYKNTKPIVYYGSSITQGGCASRPGMSYQAIISRKFNYDFINLGFSGSAKAEDLLIDYIKNLDMSMFVYDYDHNAPNPEHLNQTHEKMFKAVRDMHPDIPIIIMPRPKFELTDVEQMRQKIIETTYNNAIASGDKNVYFISSRKLAEFCKNEGTVDGCHPTDFGFVSIAKALSEVIENISII